MFRMETPLKYVIEHQLCKYTLDLGIAEYFVGNTTKVCGYISVVILSI